MASSRISSNSPDWKDGVSALLAMGKALGGTTEVALRLSGTEGRPSARLMGRIVAMDHDQQAVRCLASASVGIGGNGCGDIPAALLSLAYELDRDCYRRTTGMGVKEA